MNNRSWWFPGGGLEGVAFPQNEVLQSSAWATLGDDALDFVNLSALLVDLFRRGACERLRAIREEGEAVVVDFESADVEHRMDGPGGREVELVRICVRDASNGKRTNVLEHEFGSEFTVFPDEFQVIRGQQDAVAYGEGHVPAVLIGVLRLALLRLENTLLGEFVCSVEGADALRGLWILVESSTGESVVERHLHLLTVVEEKRSKPSGSVLGTVDCNLLTLQMIIPIILAKIDVVAETFLECAVGTLGLPSVWGWYAVDIVSLVPRQLQKFRQKCAVKRGSRSLRIDSGTPWCRTTSRWNSLDNSGAETVVVVAT
jgi:hypothetical protein